jgi:hypothetical protein
LTGIVDQAGGLAEPRLGAADRLLERAIVGDVGLGISGAVGWQVIHRIHVPRDQ